MKVFLDANVIVAAHQWPKGVCAQVLERVYGEHELAVGEVVIGEVKRILREKFSVPSEKIELLETALRQSPVESEPDQPASLPIDDPDDEWVVASAIQAEADVLVTGDKPLRGCDKHISELIICTPREFLEMSTTEEEEGE